MGCFQQMTTFKSSPFNIHSSIIRLTFWTVYYGRLRNPMAIVDGLRFLSAQWASGPTPHSRIPLPEARFYLSSARLYRGHIVYHCVSQFYAMSVTLMASNLADRLSP